MLTDVQALVFSALLAGLMLLAASALRAKIWTVAGQKVAFGNRDHVPEISILAGRADRAARNMLEGLLLFVAVLVAERASLGAGAGRGISDASLGASLFFWARVVYWPVYLAGVAYVRTAVWIVSIAGLVMLGLRALG